MFGVIIAATGGVAFVDTGLVLAVDHVLCGFAADGCSVIIRDESF